jgi:hypothetical protein
MSENQKPGMPATAPQPPSTSEDGRLETRRATGEAGPVNARLKMLRTLDGVAPESRFSWFEDFNGGKPARVNTPVVEVVA